MTTTFTQNDVYTPAEANAFHEGHEDALVANFNDTEAKTINPAYSEAEKTAYLEGFSTGRLNFGGIAYKKDGVTSPVSAE